MPRAVRRLLAIITLAIGAVAPGAARADPPRIDALAPLGVQRGVTTEVVVSGVDLVGNPRWVGSFAAQVGAVEPAPTAGKPGAGTAWKIRVTPDPDVPVGIYLVRVQTEGGLSNPIPFAVDQVPHRSEVEENGPFRLAQPVETPVVVEGQASGADVDAFRFTGRKGERVVIDAACARVGSGVDPAIRLSTAGRRLIASADDTPGLLTDARLFAELPSDGDYVVELADTRYQGTGPRTHYRLLIGRGIAAPASVWPLGGRRGEQVPIELSGGTLAGPTPHLADVALARALEVEPGQVAPRITEATAHLAATDPVPSGGWALRDVEGLPPLAVGDALEYRESTDPAAGPIRGAIPAAFNGRIQAPGDADTFVVTAVTPGQKVRVALVAAGVGSLLDGVLQVHGNKGAGLATNDDAAIPARHKPKGPPPAPNAPKKPPILSLDPAAVVTIPAGTTEIAVTVRDLDGAGGPGYPYRLTVEPIGPGFTIAASTQDQLNIPRGGTVGIAIDAERTDCDEPITLDIANPPPGVAVRPGLIPAGQTAGSLSLSAAPDASFEAVTLRIVGRAAGAAGPIIAEATRTTILAQQADFATHFVTRSGLLAAPATASPVTLTGPEAPVEVVLGFPASIPIRAVRSPGAEDVVLTFGSLPTIPNLAIAADPKLAARASEGAITVTTTPDTPAGPVVVVLNAKGKFGDRDRTIALPAVTLNVVSPAAIALAGSQVQLPAGGAVEVKGTLARRGPFREPVTVKLAALPAGVKAAPVVVPPGATDFAIKLTADPKAAPASATASVTATFKLGPKDHSPPALPLAIKVVPAP